MHAESMSESTDGRPSPTYHFILTLAWSGPNGGPWSSQTVHGPANARPGTSRGDLFSELLDHARSSIGAPDNATVMFFALEPNEL